MLYTCTHLLYVYIVTTTTESKNVLVLETSSQCQLLVFLFHEHVSFLSSQLVSLSGCSAVVLSHIAAVENEVVWSGKEAQREFTTKG